MSSRRSLFSHDRESDEEFKGSRGTCRWWKRSTACRQFLASLLLLPQMFTEGCIMFWPFASTSAIKEKYDMSTFNFTLLNTIIHCGGISGMIFVACLLDRAGSRNIMMALMMPCIFAWICIAFGDDISFILIGRFIHGFCGYTIMVMVMLYMADCAEAEIRGHVGLIAHFGIALGMMYVVILDYLLNNVQWLALMGTIPPAVGFICLIFLPDSPIFLLQRNNTPRAQESLQWFRGDDCDITDEFFKLRSFVADSDSGNANLLELLNRPMLRKPVMMGAFVTSAQQLCGIHVMLTYLSAVEVGIEIPIPARTLSGLVMTNGVLIGILISFLLCDRIGRRNMLILSSCIMGLFSIFIGIILLTVSDLKPITWLLYVLLFIYDFGFGCGWGPMPWFILGELFPLEVRTFGVVFSATLNFILKWVLTHTLSALSGQGSIGMLYSLYGGPSFLAALAVYCYLVETKGKSFKEIRDMFERMSSQTDM